MPKPSEPKPPRRENDDPPKQGKQDQPSDKKQYSTGPWRSLRGFRKAGIAELPFEIQAPPAPKTVKEWMEAVSFASRLPLQRRIITFLLWIYACLLAATTAILFLQGFHVGGFALDAKTLWGLVAATVGEIGGLLLLTFRVVFGKPGKKG
jgi:hypothetical protein